MRVGVIRDEFSGQVEGKIAVALFKVDGLMKVRLLHMNIYSPEYICQK